MFHLIHKVSFRFKEFMHPASERGYLAWKNTVVTSDKRTWQRSIDSEYAAPSRHRHRPLESCAKWMLVHSKPAGVS